MGGQCRNRDEPARGPGDTRVAKSRDHSVQLAAVGLREDVRQPVVQHGALVTSRGMERCVPPDQRPLRAVRRNYLTQDVCPSAAPSTGQENDSGSVGLEAHLQLRADRCNVDVFAGTAPRIGVAGRPYSAAAQGADEVVEVGLNRRVGDPQTLHVAEGEQFFREILLLRHRGIGEQDWQHGDFEGKSQASLSWMMPQRIASPRRLDIGIIQKYIEHMKQTSKPRNRGRLELKVADEVWIATALLHRENPDRGDFTVAEIVERARREQLTPELRPGVYVHAVLHSVANRSPNPGRYRMLFETTQNRRRLYRPGDPAHEARRGAKMTPARSAIAPKYHPLLDWYERRIRVATWAQTRGGSSPSPAGLRPGALGPGTC